MSLTHRFCRPEYENAKYDPDPRSGALAYGRYYPGRLLSGTTPGR